MPSPHDAVTLRDFLERLFADHASLHLKEAAATEREAALVRTVLEQRMVDHDLRHNEQHLADQRAINEARARVEQRLGALNELRDEVTKDRSEFVKVDVFLTRAAQADKERTQFREDLSGIREDLAASKGRQAAYAVVLSIGLVVVPFLILLAFRLSGT